MALLDLDDLDDEEPFEVVGEVEGRVLVVPIAPPNSGDVTRCRPIGCYDAPSNLIDQYRRDR